MRLLNDGAPGNGMGITANEKAWVEFLRMISRDSDPPVTLQAVQVLRRVLGSPRHRQLARRP